mmetsp:Transcript_24316/g.21258  ORF Transcript_24316/g.21258 Transcript_24316/m.21258 type:complete len:199 (+) Transcript_24316:92-688(+)
MLLSLFVISGSIIYLSSAADLCLPTNNCEGSSEASSSQYIEKGSVICNADYSNNDCSGDPSDSDCYQDSTTDDVIEIKSGCDAYMKLKVYQQELSDSQCGNRDTWSEEVIPTGCADGGESAIEYACYESSVAVNYYNNSQGSCSGTAYLSIELKSGCQIHEISGDRYYMEILHCGVCMSKPSLFILGLIFMAIIYVIN